MGIPVQRIHTGRIGAIKSVQRLKRLRRVLNLAVVVLLLVVADPRLTHAQAQDASGGCYAAVVVAVCEGLGLTTLLRPNGSPPSHSSPSTASQTQYVPYEKISTSPDGKPCVTTGYRPVTDTSIPLGLYSIPDQDFGNILADYPRCPDQPSQAPEDPSAIALRYWEQIPLPKPNPTIAPGWAITGKLAYLETNGELRHTYTNSTAIGPLEIVATGTYYVDWGDGEKSGPHTVEGKPWPEGTITHEYTWARTYNIVVTERWTATWRLGGKSGTLRELQTTGRIDNFPARQIQAVIR